MYQYKNLDGSFSNVEVLERKDNLVYVREGGTLYYWCNASDLVEVKEEEKKEENPQKETYQMTPIQYHNYVITNTMKKYKCTRKKAEYTHPKWQTDIKHMDVLFAAIKDGKIIPDRVIDKLTDGQRYRLVHDNPNYFEKNPYFSPDIRNKKSKVWFTAS